MRGRVPESSAPVPETGQEFGSSDHVWPQRTFPPGGWTLGCLEAGNACSVKEGRWAQEQGCGALGTQVGEVELTKQGLLF